MRRRCWGAFALSSRPCGEVAVILEKAMYDGSGIRPAEEAFVWFSETAGGEGLAWQRARLG